MVKKEEILYELDRDFRKLKTKYEDHKSRVIKAIDWFIEHDLTPLKEDRFINHSVKYKKVVCMIVEANMGSVPFWDCYFVLYPVRAKDDIGRGKGCAVKLEF